MSSAIVLLSAGLDSTVNLYRAVKDHKIALALTIDYGQKAARKEIDRAKKISEHLQIQHQVIELPWLKNITHTSLVNLNAKIPTKSQVSIDDIKVSNETARAVWVPNRNGVFLNIAASFAESLKAEFVIVGFNKEEATTFPDNSKKFMTSIDESFGFSTMSQVKVLSYTVDMNKTEIVKLANELNVNLDLVWPCYFSGEKFCGECESCQRFYRAVKEA
jgi:7-cyano-7-deazaguanine synthase